MELKELHEERAKVVRSLNELSDMVANEGRAFTPEELVRFDQLNAEQGKMLEQIQTKERIEKSKALTANNSQVLRESQGLPSGKDVDNAFRAWALRSTGNVVSDSLRRSADRAGIDIYGEAFVVRDQDVGTAANGGYTTNSNIYSGLVESRKAFGGVQSLVTQINTPTGESLAFATNNDTSNTGAWGSELGTVSNTSMSFGQKTLSAYLNVSGVFPCSLLLLQDSSVDVESLIGRALGVRLARNLADGLVNGDGSGKPTGIKASATSAFTTASSPTDLAVSDLIDLYMGVNAAYRNSPNAAWVINSTTYGEFLKMVDSYGRPLLTPDYNQQGFGYLLGKKVVVDDACPNTAAGLKPIFFGDWSSYYLRRAGGVTISMDRSLYFKELGAAFIAFERVDGKLMDTAAVKTITMHA